MRKSVASETPSTEVARTSLKEEKFAWLGTASTKNCIPTLALNTTSVETQMENIVGCGVLQPLTNLGRIGTIVIQWDFWMV